MNNFVKFLWEFIRGDTLTPIFEQWVYDTRELEDFLGSSMYLQLIELNFADRYAVATMKGQLQEWVDKNYPRTCDCITWKHQEKIPLSTETRPELFEKKFRVLRRRTPWLDLVCCEQCQTYWYVAVDTIDDDYYLRRLNGEIAQGIIDRDIWPECFDKDEKFWPPIGWLKSDGYKNLKDWQIRNNHNL